MDSENVELARRAFEAFERRDLSQIEEICQPDIEMDWSRRLIDPVVTRGFDGIQSFFDEVTAIFEEATFEEEEILEIGDKVLVVSTGHFRGRASGIEVKARAANVWTIRDGKLARFCFYQSKEDALKDLGVEESSLPGEPERTR
jgi:ketosteroid isomerase-like protein